MQPADRALDRLRFRDLLAAMFADVPGRVELRVIRLGVPGLVARAFFKLFKADAIVAFCKKHQRDELYFGVALRGAADVGTLENCVALTALHCDIDFKDLPEPEARERVGRSPIPASIIVASGGGLHVYWLLTEPIMLPAEASLASGLLKRLAAYLGGDPVSAEPVHILRVPGGLNHKYTPARPVTVEFLDSGRRYNLGDFDWLPSETPTTTAAVPFIVPETIRPGKRDTTLYTLGRSLKAKHIPASVIEIALQAVNAQLCDPPQSSTEMAKTIHNATTQPDRKDFRPIDAPATDPAAEVPTRTLADVHDVFSRWLGADYDLAALDAVLATAAAERLTGDPLWLLLISGSGNAKTETVQALSGAGALVTSTIASEGALLSGSAKRERAKDASGGLLRRIGARGILVVKDVTSILSMNRDARASLLAAFREIHDGRWERNVGTDGGRTLTWTGRIVVIGATTTAWDRAHDVIASMGDRFVIVRMDSTTARVQAAFQSRQNTGHELTMRAEMTQVVGGLLSHVKADHTLELPHDAEVRLVDAANVVTLARTGVDYDYRGDVIDCHAPEMPTRFVKQLYQLMRGATAIGVSAQDAFQLAIRCARDSMPPLRLAILDDVAAHPDTTTQGVRRRLEKPRTTVDRQLQSLHMLGILKCNEEETARGGRSMTLWRYHLAEGISPDVLSPAALPLPEMLPTVRVGVGKREEPTAGDVDVCIPADISGKAVPDETADLHPDCLWRDPEQAEDQWTVR